MSAPKLTPEIGIQLKSVLVATDFSAASDKALRHAVAIARYYGSKLYLIHVVSALGFNMVGPEAIAQASDLAWRDARTIERRLMLDGALGDISHDVIVREGDVWREVEQVIELAQIDLVVIGTHSRTGISKLVLGSVAEQIFRHATCPVLTIGPNSPVEAHAEPTEDLRSLLFPTDFGEKSLMALPYALSFARQRRSRVVLLHVLSPVPQVDGNRWYTAEDVFQERKAARESAIKRLKALVAESRSQVEPICIVEFGDPAEWILRAADELRVEGIVIGLNHITHIERTSHLPWSLTYKVVCAATCPVLTVRPPSS